MRRVWGCALNDRDFRLERAAHVRTVTMASGATASQIVWKSARGSRDIEHVGSAHSLQKSEYSISPQPSTRLSWPTP